MKSKFFYATLLGLMLQFSLVAQNPVKWTFTTKPAEGDQVDLIFTATIEDGWFTYSQFLESDEGPVATSFGYAIDDNTKIIGKCVESGELIKVYDKVFGMNVAKFKHLAVFTQRVQVKDASQPIEGFVEYMVCNEEMCLPPKKVAFSLKL